MPVRYGIIGVGKQGSMYAKRMAMGHAKNAKLVAIADISEDRRAWAKKSLKGVEVFEDYKEMIEKANLNAVMVVVPHYFHTTIAKYTISHGINTLVDKPVSVYTKDARELNEFAAQYPEVAFGMMYNQRTNPLYKKAKELMEDGTMGSLKRVSWIITDWYRPQAYYNQGGWRGTWNGEGGGALINQCPHQLDLIQWIVGMPKMVRAYNQVGFNRDITVENDVTAYFQYEGGGTGTFITSTHDAPGTNRLEIDCDGGQIIIDKNNMKVIILKEKESTYGQTVKKFMPKPPAKVEKYSMNPIQMGLNQLKGQHFGVINAFTKHITHGTPMTGKGIEGINGLTISNAIMLSSWTGEDIHLPINEEQFIEELNKRKAEENEYLSKKEAE